MLPVCSPQCGPSDAVKDRLYDQLSASASLIPYSDCNGHGGRTGSSYKIVHGDYGYGMPVPAIECERIMEYALAYDLLLCNMCLKKRNSHLITDKSGNKACVISKGPVTGVMVIIVWNYREKGLCPGRRQSSREAPSEDCREPHTTVELCPRKSNTDTILWCGKCRRNA